MAEDMDTAAQGSGTGGARRKSAAAITNNNPSKKVWLTWGLEERAWGRLGAGADLCT